MTVSAAPRPHVDLQNAVVRFAGDSGDGMQLTGTEFTREAALYGNDLATFPDYPAEIRAPAGTTAGVSAKDASRCKNFYALGLVFWIYSRDIEREEQAIRERFKKSPPLAEANVRAFKAGYNYGETIEALDAPYSIQPARLKPGKYRNV